MNAKTEQEEVLEPEKGWEPRVIEGGKKDIIPAQPSGKGPPPTDFLTPMGEGTVFLVKPRKFNTFLCIEFTVKESHEKSVLLFSDMWHMVGIGEPDEDHVLPVSPLEFCLAFDLVDVLKEGHKDT